MSDHAETMQDPTSVSDPDTIVKEDATTDAPSTADSPKAEGDPGSVTGAESSGLGSGLTAATTATTDSVFSMFGGGPKKEKREEPEDEEGEPSGSSKAKKDADDAQVVYPGVRLYFFCLLFSYHISGPVLFSQFTLTTSSHHVFVMSLLLDLHLFGRRLFSCVGTDLMV